MKSDKRQTMVMIGISLIILAAVFIAISLTQPKATPKADITATLVSAEYGEKETKLHIESRTLIEAEYPININTATLEQLMSIDGIGEKRASAIIEYREALGGYTSVEQIMQIKGIDQATYDMIAEYLTV